MTILKPEVTTNANIRQSKMGEEKANFLSWIINHAVGIILLLLSTVQHGHWTSYCGREQCHSQQPKWSTYHGLMVSHGVFQPSSLTESGHQLDRGKSIYHVLRPWSTWVTYKKTSIQCVSLNTQKRRWNHHWDNARGMGPCVRDLIKVSNLYTY